MVQYAENFGDLLLLYRTNKGLTLKQLVKQLVKELEVDAGTISRWESGERNPSKKHQKRIQIFSDRI